MQLEELRQALHDSVDGKQLGEFFGIVALKKRVSFSYVRPNRRVLFLTCVTTIDIFLGPTALYRVIHYHKRGINLALVRERPKIARKRLLLRFEVRRISWVGDNLAQAVIANEHGFCLAKIRVNYFIVLAHLGVEYVLESVLLALDFSSIVDWLVALRLSFGFFLLLLLGLILWLVLASSSTTVA